MNLEVISDLRRAVDCAAGRFDSDANSPNIITTETHARLLEALDREAKNHLTPEQLEKEVQEFGVELDKFLAMVLDEAVLSGRRCASTPNLFAMRNHLTRHVTYLFDVARYNERKRIVEQLDKKLHEVVGSVRW